MIMTKGRMIQELKKNEVRSGEKEGAKVQLEHLKTHQIIDLYYKFCK